MSTEKVPQSDYIGDFGRGECDWAGNVTIVRSPKPVLVAAETCLHERYKDSRVKGEWFELTDFEVAEVLEYMRLQSDA